MAMKLNPVTLEVVRNALPAIANEMAVDLHRTSYNMMIYEVRDFCTALVAPDGALVSQNVGGVSHFVADLGVVIEDGMRQHSADGFKAEDVIITNHQRVAGQHLNNVVIYMPYFFEGELLMFSVVRAHWIDVGGTSTGFGAGSHVVDPWAEGLQLDQLKIYEAGKPVEVLLKVIRDNIRYPEGSMGDMRSQIAACRLALRRLDELFRKYGRDTMVDAIKQVFAETETRCRAIVATIPDGVYEAQSFYDVPAAERPLKLTVHAKVTVSGGDMTIDLSGCAPEQRLAINSRTLAGARVAYKNLTAPLEPVNEGSFSALKVIIPEGNIMMARYPAPMANWSGMIPTVVDTIITALAPAIPDRIPAAHHGTLGGSIVFFGVNPKTGKRFLVQSIEGGGWGGRPHEDGESGSVSICQGDVRNGTLEGIEMKNPILVEARSLRPDSGDAGKFRGGLGLDVRARSLTEGRWMLGGRQRGSTPPWGILGGKPADVPVYLLKQPGDNDFAPKIAHRHLVPADSEVVVRTSGGGGWGDPLQRDPEMVRWDVIEGYVSREAARAEYGVVLGADLALDRAATDRLRAERKTAAAQAAE
jgi:N-methylhydantoinase B